MALRKPAILIDGLIYFLRHFVMVILGCRVAPGVQLAAFIWRIENGLSIRSDECSLTF